MIAKKYLSANEINHDSFELAHMIYMTGYRPDAIIALWRGGSPVGMVVQEFMKVKGVNSYHTAVKCVSYTGIEASGEPVIENVEEVKRMMRPEWSLLVVDDIFDTGKTARAVKAQLSPFVRELKVATLYFKPRRNETDMEPDFYVRKTDSWLVFPHEIAGLTQEEIMQKDPFIYGLLYSDGNGGDVVGAGGNAR